MHTLFLRQLNAQRHELENLFVGIGQSLTLFSFRKV